MQSPRWDQEAATLRADARKDYGGFPRRTKDVFKQKTQRFRLPNLSDSQMLVLSTTVVYFLTVCLYYFAFFRHAKVVLLFTAASLLSCPAFAMLNGRFEVSLAACCGVAVLLGAIAGLYSYANFGFFSWKLFTSRTYENVVPSEDPGMVADAARMSFAKEAYLDQARSVGFAAEDGNLYCAAPISSHSAPKEEVNFWAVGVNCCALSGRFECDAAPKQTGHGIILWDQRQHFHDARRKSAATFGIHGVKKTTRISKGLRQTELREVFALANVSMEAAACPYIVRYYSSWLEDGRLHIQTELCRCSLRDRLNERKAWPVASFTENEILEVLRHVAAGLQVLHSLGFVHLDIKPDNILVARSDEGCYKIADLGLAAAAMGTGCDDITEGDCRYLAKEVLRGDLRDLPKADVFSLGLVLYELAINPRGLPSNGPEWQMIRERLEVQILSQLSQNMQLLLQEMACANKELRPTCEALLQRVGNSTPEMKALEEENRRCREEAARNKQRADSYWQEIVQMKKQELLTTSGAVPLPMREDESKVQLRRSHTSH